MKRTMGGHGIDPFVQRGVELGDDALFPSTIPMSQERLRLVDRVLWGAISHRRH